MNSLFKFDAGFDAHIIGTDEAGRGPGAGGVYAAAVNFPKNFLTVLSKQEIETLKKLNDSKKLTQKTREELAVIIKKCAHYSVQCVEVETIEKINILQASLLAMKIVCEEVVAAAKIAVSDDRQILVDGNKKIPNFNYSQTPIKKGDTISASIAAASVLAKVERDNYMQKLHKKYPQYNWVKNKGYLTPQHIEAIKKCGLTPHHRKTFLKKIKGL